MKQFVRLACLGVLLIVGAVACDDSGRDQARPKSNARDKVAETRTSAAQAQETAMPTVIPADVKYTVINTDVIPGIKRSLDVRLSRKVEEDVLRSIAMNLKKDDPKRYEEDVHRILPSRYGGGRWRVGDNALQSRA